MRAGEGRRHSRGKVERLLLLLTILGLNQCTQETHANFDHSANVDEKHQLGNIAQILAVHAADVKESGLRAKRRVAEGQASVVFPSEQPAHQHATVVTACGLRGGRTCFERNTFFECALRLV